MNDLVAQLEDLPDLRPFPAIATKVASAVGDPDTNSSDITDLISCEPTIAMRVLRVANSPTFGFAREVRSISQAVVVLGGRAIRDIVLAVAAAELFESNGKVETERRELWNHSLACGTVAGALAAHTQTISKEEAFLSGILHDAGKLLFYDLVPEEYAQLESANSARTIISAETEAFGVNHQELGERCCEEWGLPNEVYDAVCFHHSPDDAFDSPELAELIFMADALARSWEMGRRSKIPEDLSAINFTKHGLNEEALEQIRNTAESDYEAFLSACSD